MFLPFRIIKSVTKIGIYATGVTIGGVGVFAWKTKPTDESLNYHLANEINDQINSKTNSKSDLIDPRMVKIATAQHFDDYVFAKVATVKYFNEKKQYLGFVNHWYPINNS